MKVYLECLHNYAAWGIWKARTAKILQGKAVSVKEVVFLAFQQAEDRFEAKAQSVHQSNCVNWNCYVCCMQKDEPIFFVWEFPQ